MKGTSPVSHFTDQGHAFDEHRWNLIKMRWCSGLGFLIYPLWLLLKWILVITSYDSFWQRVAASTPCLIIYLLTFRKQMRQSLLERLYVRAAYVIVIHMYYLIYRNQVNSLYMIAGYCTVISVGLALLNVKSLTRYFILNLGLAGALCFVFKNVESFQLFFCIFCACAVIFAALKSQEVLIDRIKESRNLLSENNRTLDNMLNSLGQGFLSVGPDGKCLSVYSQACLELFGASPAEHTIFSLLQLPEDKTLEAMTYLPKIFSGEFPPHLIEVVLPNVAPIPGKRIELEYIPTFTSDEKIRDIVVVATDKTDKARAEQEIERERRNSQMIATITKEKAAFHIFYTECLEQIERFRTIPSGQQDNPETRADFKNFLHSLKGNAAVFAIDDLSRLAHRLEDEWSAAEEVPPANLFSEQIEQINSAMQSFVKLNAAILGKEFTAERPVELTLSQYKHLIADAEFPKVPVSLQTAIYAMAKKSIWSYFEIYRTLCGSIARQRGKQVEPVEFTGEDISILPEAFRALFTSFVHVFRNAVDHGLETPEVRKQQGKSESGRIKVRFSRVVEAQREWIGIDVSDDGAGIDPNAIRAKLVRMGESEESVKRIPDAEVITAIFKPGFTTKTAVSDLSGRGVGMNAVQVQVEQLGGSVSVRSQVGVGTTISVKFPDIKTQQFFSKQHDPR